MTRTPPATVSIDGGKPVDLLAPFPCESYWDWRLRMERQGRAPKPTPQPLDGGLHPTFPAASDA